MKNRTRCFRCAYPLAVKFSGANLLAVAAFCLAHITIANAQTPSVKTCSAFAADGTLATGTLDKGELDTRLTIPGTRAKVIHTAIGNAWGCELGFSADGKWLTSVLTAEKLTIQILNVKENELHRQFSSEWHTFHNMALEPGYGFRFLGGFAADDSIILWRYVPEDGPTPNDASILHLHYQRWSIEGELTSDQDLGLLGFAGRGGRGPILGPEAKQFWIPWGEDGYQHYRFDDDRAVSQGTLTLPKDNSSMPSYLSTMHRFLTVLGDKTKQRAALLDDTGKIDSEIDLPFFPNLLNSVVPDWFYVRHLVRSADDRFIAIGRSRVAWVLIDTDRDWGSEILVLDTHSFKVFSTLKVGLGGIQSLAIDHREGKIRLVGYWRGRWHDIAKDEQGRSDWRESHGS